MHHVSGHRIPVPVGDSRPRLAILLLVLAAVLTPAAEGGPATAAPEATAASADRPVTGAWLQPVDQADAAIRQRALTAAPTAETDTSGEAMVLVVIITLAMGVAGWLVWRGTQTPAPAPAKPGAGTRFTVVPDDHHRYSPAGTSIIARTTAFIRKGTGALRRSGR